MLCCGSGLPVFFRLAPANGHDAPFAQPLLQTAPCAPAWCASLRPMGERHSSPGSHCRRRHRGHSLPSQEPHGPLLRAAHLNERPPGQTPTWANAPVSSDSSGASSCSSVCNACPSPASRPSPARSPSPTPPSFSWRSVPTTLVVPTSFALPPASSLTTGRVSYELGNALRSRHFVDNLEPLLVNLLCTS